MPLAPYQVNGGVTLERLMICSWLVYGLDLVVDLVVATILIINREHRHIGLKE